MCWFPGEKGWCRLELLAARLRGFRLETAMYAGQTLFAQLMEFVPWTTFARLVERYCGDHRVRTLTCAEQYRAMAFAQLSYRESLRDIETCLSAQTAKLYHMGFREPAGAQFGRCQRDAGLAYYAALAQTLIVQARGCMPVKTSGWT